MIFFLNFNKMHVINGHIYLITNMVNNKSYVGKRISSPELSLDYWGSGMIIKSAIKKYGKSNFKKEILHSNITEISELDRLEIFYIDKYKTLKQFGGYNISKGGGNNIGHTLSAKERIHNSLIGNKRNLGKKRTELQKKELSSKHQGKIFSDETRKKISLKRIGSKASDETRRKISDKTKGRQSSFKGKQHSLDSRFKISLIQKLKNSFNTHDTDLISNTINVSLEKINNSDFSCEIKINLIEYLNTIINTYK